MRCDGLNAQGYPGYNAHPGSAPFVIAVPFEEAIRTPPSCPLHHRPYLTDGAYALGELAARFRESGEITERCEVAYGTEQYAFCTPHGWAGSAGDTTEAGCPYQRLAAWLVRRHEYGAAIQPAGG